LVHVLADGFDGLHDRRLPVPHDQLRPPRG
jgi:hypothetical protein